MVILIGFIPEHVPQEKILKEIDWEVADGVNLAQDKDK
jgi:hypothetical protein